MVRKDIAGRISSGMGIRSHRRPVLVRRIWQIGRFDPTFLDGTTENDVIKEFQYLPNPILFDIFVFPNAGGNHGAEFSAPGHRH